MTDPPGGVSRSDAFRVWVRIAAASFGGPAGQIAVVHRLVVEEKKWLSEERFLHALSYCMLLPGPEAQQLTTYVGWLLHGVRGGLIAGSLFILPGFLVILLLSILYTGYRDAGLVAGAFVGLKPAVIAIVLEAIVRLRRRALTTTSSIAIAAAAFVGIFVLGFPFPFIVLGAAVTGLLVEWSRRRRGGHGPTVTGPPALPMPSLRAAGKTALLWLAIWTIPLAVLGVALGSNHILVREGVFFSKVAVVTFGGAYAVLSYVAQQAVEAFQWLNPGEMLDGLGLAETTPGPLIQVVQFVGFLGAYRHPGAMSPLSAGVAGSIVTTWTTFAPCFLFIFVGAPFVEYLRENRTLNAALRGITAAVVGVVLNLAVWFSLHTLFRELHTWHLGTARLLVPVPATLDWRSLVIVVGSVIAMFRYKTGMFSTLGGAALLGIMLHSI